MLLEVLSFIKCNGLLTFFRSLGRRSMFFVVSWGKSRLQRFTVTMNSIL